MPHFSVPPPVGRDGRVLALLTVVQSVSFGSFAACGAIFFVRSAGLGVREIGAGAAIAGLAALATAALVGRLADRVGPREVLVFLCAAQAVLYASYSLVHDFWFFLAVICSLTAADQGAWVARNTVIATVTAGRDRVRLKAHLRSLSKVGMAAGTGLAAIPLHLDTRAAYLGVVFANAAASGVTAILAARLSRPARWPAARPSRPPAPPAGPVWRDRPYLAVALLCGLLATYHSLLTIALPLWVATRTRAPGPVIAGLFIVNTVLSVALQARASRRADTARAARRLARLGARLIAPACALIAVAATVPAGPAVVLLAGGVVVLTVGELWISAAAWSLSFELADSRAPGRYQGMFSLGMSIDAIVGPLLATGLVLGFGIAGWLAAGLLFVLLGTAVAVAAQQAVLTRPLLTPGLGPDADRTVLLVGAEPTVRLAYADPTVRLAYPEAATDLLSVVPCGADQMVTLAVAGRYGG